MAVETFGAMKIVQAFGQEQRETERFAGAVERSFAAAKRRIRIRAIMTALVIGLIFGAVKLKLPLQQQLAIAVAIIAVTAVPLLFVSTVPLLTIAVFASGIAISTTFITAFGLIERRLPASMLTEGITWVMTGIGIGMADVQDAEDAPAGLFQTPETRTLKTERAIDKLREKFGKDAVVAGRALKP